MVIGQPQKWLDKALVRALLMRTCRGEASNPPGRHDARYYEGV